MRVHGKLEFSHFLEDFPPRDVAVIHFRQSTSKPREEGQSLIETALILPFLLMIAFNAINYGYFFLVALNIAAAPRSGVEYSIQGFATPGQFSLPAAGPNTNAATVSFLTYEDMRGALGGSASTPIRVCTKLLGVTGSGTTLTANCASYGNTPQRAFPANNPDPEAPRFVLHRVDVEYTVTPLIPAQVFNLTLVPELSFHRQVSMRAID